jgi:alpha-D-xyloside xylohydrolase
MVRAVALEFPHDREVLDLTDQYLFGSALLVCPVTQPMYYNKQSQPIAGAAKSRIVYLPSGAAWFDFWTADQHAGGCQIDANAPLNVMPLFVRAGSILPMTAVMQYVDELPNAAYEVRVYTGCDAVFTLYEDAGDGYAYEHGEFARVRIEWSEDAGELVLHAREGKFPALVRERDFCVTLFSSLGRQVHSLQYHGEEIRICSSQVHWDKERER